MLENQFKLLQTIIDRCVKHDNDVLMDALSMKKSYLNAEQLPDYIRKEIFRVTEELVAINQKVPPLRVFAFDWKTIDFLWDSSFIENLTLSERKKYNAFAYENFDYKQYNDNTASYDEVLPYFSILVRLVVYSKYLEELQKREVELLSLQETPNKIKKNKENVLPKKIAGKDNPFNCKLDSDAFRILTDCVNDAHIFTTEITPKILEDFFYCRLAGALKSANNRLLAYFMMKLSVNEYITYEWQSVIANNRLIFASKKEKYLNNSDLSTANDSIKYILPKKSAIIDKYIKELKKY